MNYILALETISITACNNLDHDDNISSSIDKTKGGVEIGCVKLNPDQEKEINKIAKWSDDKELVKSLKKQEN